LNIKSIHKVIQESFKRGDLPIISVHAGIEHINIPDILNIIWSRALAEIAPYVYYGHHPHVLQGLEMYKDSLIAHSLGNFIFDDVMDDNGEIKVKLTDNNRYSAILEIVIVKNKIESYRMRPIQIGKGTIKIMDYESYSPNKYDYTRALTDPNGYNEIRNTLINKRLKERKKLRDFKWMLRHLTFRYLKLLLDMKRNKKSYESNVLQYLKNYQH